MRRKTSTARIAAFFAAAVATFALSPAAAQTGAPDGITVTLGLGAGIAPDYFGSKTTSVGPTGAFALQELILPGGLGFGSEAARPFEPGFGVRGAFRYIPSRRASKNRELRGLDTIDRTVELGVGVVHVTEFGRVYGEVRRGIGGHKGWVGEVGVDAILRPSPQLAIAAGPRARWGDKTFTRTYFGVTADEAANSDFTAFRPGGGIVSTGLEVNARYDFQNGWGLLGRVGWDRLRGDAARSPITRQGSRDQYAARLIVTRSFSFGR